MSGGPLTEQLQQFLLRLMVEARLPAVRFHAAVVACLAGAAINFSTLRRRFGPIAHLLSGIVSLVSVSSTTKTARIFAGRVLLALALIR